MRAACSCLPASATRKKIFLNVSAVHIGSLREALGGPGDSVSMTLRQVSYGSSGPSKRNMRMPTCGG